MSILTYGATKLVNKLKIDFETVRKSCQLYANEVDEFVNIIAINRGGLVPGVIMSHMIENSSFSIIDYRTRDGETKDLRFVMNNMRSLENSKNLIVDDICDSGLTLCHVSAMFDEMDIDTESFTICNKLSAIHQPTVSFHIVQDDTWVVFPWE